MFMVVVLHVLGVGGVLAAQPPLSPGHALSWLLEAACYCAVNCFGIISGYVSHSETFSGRRTFATWAQVAFYSAGITLLFRLLVPESTRFKSVIGACFPVMTQKYWYFTAYFALAFLIPFLNTMVRNLSADRAKKLMAVLFALLSVLPMFPDRDLFYTKGGYTLLWLAALFLFGACLKKVGPNWGPSGRMCLLGYLLCVVLTAGSKIVLGALAARYGFTAVREDILLSYTSPTVVLAGIFLFQFFARCSIRRPRAVRAIAFFAPLSFGVYLIHTHPLVWNLVLNGRFSPYAALPVPLCLLAVLLTALAIFLVCIAVDWLRGKLFGWAGPRLEKLLPVRDRPTA